MEKKIIFFVALQVAVFYLLMTEALAAPKEFNFTPSNYSDAAIQAALDEAGEDSQIIVNFAQGTYNISTVLTVHSNTTINAQGATLVRSGNSLVNGYALMINTESKKTQGVLIQGSGYTLSHDIVLNGGTYDGGDVKKASGTANLINFGHATNITIKNATFKNCYGSHLIEFSGVKDSSIVNCTFDGTNFRYNTDNYESEAIQLDICGKGLNGNFGADNTPCKNIVIQGNTIKNYPRGVGNHNVIEGHYNSDISIIGNTIINTSKKEKQGIFLNKFVNSTVKGNTIQGYDCAIQIIGGSGHTVINNKISATASNGISVISGLNMKEISNNMISSAGGNGISISNASVVNTVDRNEIKQSQRNGIAIGDSKTKITALTNNTITDSKGNGISVNEKSTVSKIQGNNLSGVVGNAISIKGTTTLISSNVINNTKENAIVVDNPDLKVESVDSNTIKATKGKAVSLSRGIINDVKNNKILNTGENPIKVTGNNSKISRIMDNTIQESSSQVIAVADGGSVVTIKNNKMENGSMNGIAVTSKGKVTTIEGNTIGEMKKSGIYTSNSGSKITTISKNIISNTGSHAITAASKAYIGKVTENEISSSKGYGISATSNSNIKDISTNKLTSCKNHAVYFGKGNVKTAITGNQFKSNKKSAIYLGKGISATIKKNTISSYSAKYQQIFTTGDKNSRVMLTVNDITSKQKKITGSAPYKATVTIKIGDKTYSAKANKKGKFTMNITKQKKGTKIQMTLVDKNKNKLTATSKVK